MVSKNTTAQGAARKSVTQLSYELITSGDELLLGLTQNSHLAFIGQGLGRHGVTLRRHFTVTDDESEIESCIRASWARADVIIVTGGLGPTCDDLTREAAAKAIGQELVYDKELEAALVARLAKGGWKATPSLCRQAYRFARCEVLANEHGTAPGLWVEQEGRVLCLLPGPPSEMQPMFDEQVLPRLAKLGLVEPRESFVQVRTAGIGESALEQKLQPVFKAHGPGLSVAFCAHPGQVDCRVSSPTGELSHDKLLQIAAECAVVLNEDFVCFGHDSLVQVCADQLRAHGAMVAVAETITGGLLANAFSGLCGSGKFFAGGCICSSIDAKVQMLDVPEEIVLQHGAVSAESAVAMATGVAERLCSSYGLAIAGATSGSCGGVPENLTGDIYLALSAPHGVWAKKLHLPGARSQVKPRAITAALDWLRRELARSKACTCAGPLTQRAMQ